MQNVGSDSPVFGIHQVPKDCGICKRIGTFGSKIVDVYAGSPARRFVPYCEDVDVVVRDKSLRGFPCNLLRPPGRRRKIG